MLLLDEIRDESEGCLVCAATPRETTPFAGEGGVPAIVTLEYMAQTVAAYAGLRAHRDSRPVRLGYIIGVRTMSLAVPTLPLGEELLVFARKIWGEDELGSFECSVNTPSGPIAEALLTVFQGDLGDRR